MFINILMSVLQELSFLTASYSNNLFPEPLSKEEESRCLDLHEKGDKESRSKLIEHNLRLVAHIVKKFDHDNSNTDDLISIGTIGLIKGIDSYSKSKGTKITTYAARCIENEILMFFRANKKTNKNVSLNESIGYDKDGNEITYLDVLKTPKPDYIEKIHIRDSIGHLKKYFHILSDREKLILTKRYGLDNNDELTQKRIAKDLEISRSYVSRIEKRALTKILREFIRNKKTI